MARITVDVANVVSSIYITSVINSINMSTSSKSASFISSGTMSLISSVGTIWNAPASSASYTTVYEYNGLKIELRYQQNDNLQGYRITLNGVVIGTTDYGTGGGKIPQYYYPAFIKDDSIQMATILIGYIDNSNFVGVMDCVRYVENSKNLYTWIGTTPPLPTYTWQSVVSINGKNGILQLSQIASASINNGESVTGASASAFTSLTAQVSTMVTDDSEMSGADAGGISGSGSNSGNQSSGYAFGQGESGTNVSGGGSGYYGGEKGGSLLSGGAGSGYIGNALVSNKKMVGYNVPTSSAEATKTESVEVFDSNYVANKPKAGNGHCRIRFLREKEDVLVCSINNGAHSITSDIKPLGAVVEGVTFPSDELYWPGFGSNPYCRSAFFYTNGYTGIRFVLLFDSQPTFTKTGTHFNPVSATYDSSKGLWKCRFEETSWIDKWNNVESELDAQFDNFADFRTYVLTPKE